MSKKTTIFFTLLLTLNVILSLWSLYMGRINQVRACMAISTVNDGVMTKLNATVYDEKTVGIFNSCVGDSFFLVEW